MTKAESRQTSPFSKPFYSKSAKTFGKKIMIAIISTKGTNHCATDRLR